MANREFDLIVRTLFRVFCLDFIQQTAVFTSSKDPRMFKVITSMKRLGWPGEHLVKRVGLHKIPTGERGR